MDEPMDADSASAVAKVDDRIRLENSLTLITYHEDGPSSRFVVDRFRHSHQSSMGEPQSKGAGHVLFPEEATYLVEVAQAIVRTTEGRFMTIEELFMVLGDFSIPQQVYSAYCACKRAGFVVIRPGILVQSPLSSATTVKSDTPKESTLPPFRVLPRTLLDAFPDMGRKNTTWLHTTRPDLFPDGCRVQQGRKVTAVDAVEKEKKGKKRREPPSLRPRAWPSLAYASKNAGDWREYAALRKELLGRCRYSSPLDRTHFVLYSARGYTHSARRKGEIKPVARVAVFDFYSGRQCASHSACREDVDRRTFNDDVSGLPLLKAYVSLPRVSFTMESGAPINLRSLAGQDKKKK